MKKSLHEILVSECGYTDEEISKGILNSKAYWLLEKLPLKEHSIDFKSIKVLEYNIYYKHNKHHITFMFSHRGNPNYGKFNAHRLGDGFIEFYFEPYDYVYYIKKIYSDLLNDKLISHSTGKIRYRSFPESDYTGVPSWLMTQKQMNDYVDLIKNTVPFSNKNNYSKKEVVYVALKFVPSKMKWSKEDYYIKEKNAILSVIVRPIMIFISKGKNGKYIVDEVNFDYGNGVSCTTLKNFDFIDIYENKRITWDDLLHIDTEEDSIKYDGFWFISRDVPEEILNEMKIEIMFKNL